MGKYSDRYWPAFRSIYSTSKDITILEPNYYYKIEKQYFQNIPEPVVVNILPNDDLDQIVNELMSNNYRDSPRIVLQIPLGSDDSKAASPEDITKWYNCYFAILIKNNGITIIGLKIQVAIGAIVQ